MKQKRRDIRDYLQDIADSINDTETFVANMTYDQFIKDRKTLNAVVRSLEIIGEASKTLPDTLKAKYPQLPWKEIAGMRAKLIHAYFGTDTETIWQTIKDNLPPLKQAVRKMQEDQQNNKPKKPNSPES